MEQRALQAGGELGVTRQARLDFLGAFPAARQQALAQHLGFHPEQDREQIRIEPAGLRQVAARAVHQHVVALRQPLVDLHRNAIAKAVGAPAHGERRGPLEGVELRRSHRLGVLPHRFRGARDHPPHDTAAAQRQGLARGLQQAVLARAGRPHQINQSACHQNTLCPPRQT